jgi:Cu2+-exporting ATPase
MIISFAVWAGTGMGEATRQALHWVAAAIALPTIAVAGLPFFGAAWSALRAGRPSMDLAVSLGVLATAAMSLSEALRGGPYVWFDSATALLALLLAGRVLDRAARGRARRAVAELLSLQSGEAQLLRPDGTLAPTPVEEVEPGARLLLAPGERLRLDGVLEGGEALLDTAAITGESWPRLFAGGTAVPAGAVNVGAACVLRVTHAAADGSLARMGALLAEAERARGHHVALADRVARWFVPVVHAVAAATFALWLWFGAPWQVALMHAVAALIVTCPCGLAIAVPAVRVVTVGALFRRGVLVTSGTALERLAAATHVVLDKTGTLTEGRARLLPEPGRDGAALRLAAGMARASRHPLAQALARACPDAPAAAGVEEHPGQGLALGETRLGSARFCGVADDEGMTLWLARLGAAPVAFRFADALRPDAAEAVRALRGLGLGVELLSGDAAPAVAAAAREAGLDHWEAAATPERKAARIRELQAAGARVLMVGDGINDGAAMALADSSASPGEGTDLARQVADLVLQGNRLLALPEAVARARRAMRLSRENLAMSLAYNAVAVPAAVAGLVTPLLAAGVMATSSLAVILNALRAGRRATIRDPGSVAHGPALGEEAAHRPA